MSELLHMKLGQNIGGILLDIAQTEIQNGNPERAIKVYTDSMIGFTEEYVIKLLKNEFVLITSKDGVSVELTDWENERIANRDNITDWDLWLQNKLADMMVTVEALSGIEDEFTHAVGGWVLDFDISKPVIAYFGKPLAEQAGVHNIAAKLIAGNEFSNLSSNDENIWDDLCAKVEDDKAEKYQKVLYFIVKYVNNIRILHKEYMGFINTYLFLLKYNLVERPVFIEMKIESILHKLKEFADTAKGYYHPLYNTKLYEYKKSVYDDILSTNYGKEYCKYGVIEKNIMDGYDAGWLSPDGKFYGENGPTSSMIHLRIAEILSAGDLDGDRRLEQKGWIKIHHNEIYGAFLGRLSKEDEYQYAPTNIQVGIICDYVDKFYNGMFFCKPQIVEITEPISTYKLRQMVIREWTIADAKEGDVIYVSTEVKGIQAIFHKFENGIIYFHCNLCTDFTQGGYEPSGDVEFVMPLPKIHYQKFFQKMKEAGYEWDVKNKRLTKKKNKKL